MALNAQLEILLELQDLRGQRHELAMSQEGSAEHVERAVFGVEIAQALEQLDAKIADVEGLLEAGIRERYRRLAGSRGRGLVPVIDGTCYGCFMALPAEVASTKGANEALPVCQHCGRFLYFTR